MASSVSQTAVPVHLGGPRQLARGTLNSYSYFSTLMNREFSAITPISQIIS
jgi:hypothetical protein